MQMTIANLGGASPAQYVAQLQSSGKIAGASGRSETINGRPAWVGRVQVQDSNGQTGTLALALVTLSGNRTLQILGQTRTPGDAAEQQILDSARSIRTLTDAGRLNATPAHLKVVAAPRAGTFQDVVPGLGTQGLALDQTAIINGMELADPVRKGQLIKIVTPGRFR
jgi:predicted Zn-dependent protease